jgi:uncharacterized protein YhfF
MDAFSFGKTAEQADELAALVRTGTKTATSMLLWELEAEGRPLWRVGDRATVLDGAGRPVCVIETTELAVKPFNAVDHEFARDYGEGDCSLAWWRRVMLTYYSEIAEQLGKHPSEDMLLICERFRVVT